MAKLSQGCRPGSTAMGTHAGGILRCEGDASRRGAERLNAEQKPNHEAYS